MKLKRLHILELPDGRKFDFWELEAAQSFWAREFSELTDAVIDVYPPEGLAWGMVSFRFDPELQDWVQSN